MKQASRSEIRKLKPLLDRWVAKVEQPFYIEEDPILFMHAFNEKEDQLLAGFFAALFAWGRRDVVIAKTRDLLERMDQRPEQFIRNFTDSDADRLEGFKHRTFKPVDLYWLIRILATILQRYQSFEQFWTSCHQKATQQNRELVAVFHEEFFGIHPEAAERTRKHISNSGKNSSCKRLYLYLRWAIRSESQVDLGVMDFISSSELMIPLDVHVARQARAMGLLTRKSNDWKAVRELTDNLRILDEKDPVKYDYALFGLGVNEGNIPEKFLKNPQYVTQ